MLFSALLLALTLQYKVIGEGTEKVAKPLTLPVPLEFPNRNDRADQCWLRIEDVEITETLVIYCNIAQLFLGYYIHDYNTRKMTEDGVAVSLWIEKPRGEKNAAYGPPDIVNGVKNWRVTTVLDPTTKRRIYVSKDAVCRVIMYSREGMTNYVVDCETVLYFVNEHMSGSGFARASILITSLCALFILLVI